MLDLLHRNDLSSYSYQVEGAYMDYLLNRVSNEAILRLNVNMMLSESGSVTAIHEAGGFGDKVKNAWKKFVTFIKSLFSKFWERLNAFFLNNKEYLEKYKNIITGKKVIAEEEISYSGDMSLIANRIRINVPVYDSAPIAGIAEITQIQSGAYKPELVQKYNDIDPDKGKAEFFEKLVKGQSGVSYDDSISYSDNWKKWFMTADKNFVVENKKFKDAITNRILVDMYNFCHGADKTKANVDADTRAIDKFTEAVDKAINGINFTGTKTQVSPDAPNNVKDMENNVEKHVDAAKTQAKNQTAAKEESAIFKASYKVLRINEADESTDTNKDSGTSNSSNKQDNSGTTTNLHISSTSVDKNALDTAEKNITDPASKDNAYYTKEDGEKMVQSLSKVINLYRECCNGMITAKWTAMEQVSKDYMAIIRVHVRSHLGNTKDKTQDVTSNSTGTQYVNNKNAKYDPSSETKGKAPAKE